MQTNCPKCSQKLVVEDEKVPAGPFMLRCPKCQNAIKLPGKAGAALPGESPAAEEPPQPAAFTPSPKLSTPRTKPAEAPKPAQPPKQALPAAPTAPSQAVRQSLPAPVGEQGGAQNDGSSQRALIALDDQSVQKSMAAALRRIGFIVDVAPDSEQGVRWLERDSYTLAVTARNGKSNGAGLYNRIITFASEVRRRLFLVLVGNDLNSGDGVQAFVSMADLVLSPNDIGASDELLRSAMNERTRLYQSFLVAQVRLDARKY